MKKIIVNAILALTAVAALSQNAMASGTFPSLPDAGTTSLLLGAAVSGLMIARKYLK
jgi:hypothetical protein